MTEPLGPRNPLVQKARLLARDRKVRAESGLAILEGVRLAEEALAAGVTLEFVLYSDQLAERERGTALLRALSRSGAPLHRCSSDALHRAADTEAPQGILAAFRPRPWRLEQLRPGLCLVADHLQDPGNLGTVIRSVEALGGGGVVLCGGVDPYNPKVVRGAMGSLFRTPLVVGPADQLLAELKRSGRSLLLAEAGDGPAPWEVRLGSEVAVVIGNEGAGPSAEARALADGKVTIPMPGGAESLNAGVAASLLLYEALRQRT